MTVRILVADVRDSLPSLQAESVHCVVTSPPYWGLRDYGVAGQIGLEETPQEYVESILEVMRKVRTVLRADGTCWLNLGDSYFSDGGHTDGDCLERRGAYRIGRRPMDNYRQHRKRAAAGAEWGLKNKDLCMIPFRVAMALQADGWYVRKDIVWAKPNGMPEAVKDRPVSAHEYIFLLTKSPRYFYDHVATLEPASYGDHPRNGTPEGGYQAPGQPRHSGITKMRTNGNKARKVATEGQEGRTNDHQGYSFPWSGYTRLKRDVWTVTAKPFPGAHFATFPPDLVEPCILAGTSAKGCCPACGAPWARVVETNFLPEPDESGARAPRGDDMRQPRPPKGISDSVTRGWEPTCSCERSDVVPCTVLDPFGGAGTTGMVADRLGRDALLLELNPAYAELARDRMQADGGMLSTVKVDTMKFEVST